MAKYLALPKRLEQCTKEDINDFIRGTEQVFRFDLFGEGKNRGLDEPYSTFDGKYHWSSNKDFFVYITGLTNTSDIRSASNVLYKTVTKAPEFSEWTTTPAPEQVVESNRPTNEQLKILEEEEKIRKGSQQKSAEEAKKSVEKSIEKKEELAKEALQKESTQKGATKKTVEPTKKTPQPTQTVPEEQPVTFTPPVSYKQEVKQKSTVEDTKKDIKSSIKKEQGVQEILRGKKIYAKVEISKAVPPPDESTLNFIKEAKTHPASFQKDLAENIKAKITPSLSTKLTEAEIDVLAQKTAFDTVFAINNFPAQSAANTQTAILGALAKESQLLPKIIDSKDAIQVLQKSSDELSYFKNSTQLSKNILSSINENLATTVFGVGPENLNVTFFEKPVEGYTHEVDFGQLNEGHINLLGSQSKVFDNVGSFAGGEARNYLMGHARTFLDSQITKLPADSAVTGFYNSKFGQQILSFAGLGKANPLGDGFLVNLARQIPGGSAFFEGLGSTFGVDFGISMAVPATEIVGSTVLAAEGTALVEGVTLAGGTVLAEGTATGITAVAGTTVGVETQAVKKVAGGIVRKGLMAVATKVGLGSTITAIGQALGSFAPIVGNAIAFAATWLIGKIAEKINWAKVKEWGGAIIGGVAGLIALPFLGIGSAIGIGLGATAVSAGLGAGLGGATLAGIGSGIAGFFGALGGAFLGAIGMPILVTLLVFPVVVAIILFIINSGAYIVPPTPMTGGNIENAYIGVEKKASPSGPFQNSELPKTITYDITVTAKKGPLTDITITDGCKAISKTGAIDCPSVNLPEPPITISPSAPYSFNYTTEYDSSKYFDSLITNSITVSATADNNLESITGGTSITVGKPPSACLSLDGTWPSNYRTMVEAARTTLSSSFANYMAKVCSSGETISVVFSQTCPLGWECYGAWFNGKLWLMPGALDRGQNYTLFTLAHETGHYLQYTTSVGKTLFDSYQNTIPFPEICSYGNTNSNYVESFAETIGRYASNENNQCFGGSFKSAYPTNWQFANDRIFK